MCFNAEVMSDFQHVSYYEEPSAAEKKRAAVASVLLVVCFAVFAFAAPRDPSKVVSGLPCSVLSEEDISSVLGTSMRLMPSSGAVCRYVSTANGPSRSLFVIARRNPVVPEPPAADAVRVGGVGDEAARSNGSLFVRYGRRAYTFTVVPQTAADSGALEREVRLAKMVHGPMVAQSR
jgi:hypothetical protein